jgi:hypothetical protein
VKPEHVTHINYPVSLAVKLRLRTGHEVSLSSAVVLPGGLKLNTLPTRFESSFESDKVLRWWFDLGFPARVGSIPSTDLIQEVEDLAVKPVLACVQLSLSGDVLREAISDLDLIRQSLGLPETYSAKTRVNTIFGEMKAALVNRILQMQNYKWRKLVVSSIQAYRDLNPSGAQYGSKPLFKTYFGASRLNLSSLLV